MRNYCTLFDRNYLAQGLVLHESLKRHHSGKFTLYVLPMDEETVSTLMSMVLPNVRVILGFHETEVMRHVRDNRTYKEYCWTCASCFAEALMNEFGLSEITYLDADMMFFSDPEIIYDEIGNKSIAVVPHRLIPSKRHLAINGQFNVSWVTFKNDVGRACLRHWAAQCRRRCSEKVGCGDQVYLDEWPARYGDQLRVVQNIGVGLAPWNLANYGLSRINDVLHVYRLDAFDTIPAERVVFYHYHEFKAGVRLTNYEISSLDVEFIYKPYVEALENMKVEIEAIHI